MSLHKKQRGRKRRAQMAYKKKVRQQRAARAFDREVQEQAQFDGVRRALIESEHSGDTRMSDILKDLGDAGLLPPPLNR